MEIKADGWKESDSTVKDWSEYLNLQEGLIHGHPK